MTRHRKKVATACNSHRWVIETPSGSKTSRGVCRSCGATKRFANAIGDIMEKDDRWRRRSRLMRNQEPAPAAKDAA